MISPNERRARAQLQLVKDPLKKSPKTCSGFWLLIEIQRIISIGPQFPAMPRSASKFQNRVTMNTHADSGKPTHWTFIHSDAQIVKV